MAEERKVFVFGDPSTTTSPSWQKLEVMVGEPSLSLDPEELRDVFAEILARAAPDQPANSSRSAFSTTSASVGGDSSIPIIRSAAGSPLER